MKPKSKTRWARLYTDVNHDLYHRVIRIDPEHPVDVPIIFTDFDNPKKGMPFECVIAKGIMAAVEKDPSLFPHKVYHAHVLSRAIYLVNKINGMPTHAVCYQYDFKHLAHYFDTLNKKQFHEKFGDEGFILHLRLPKNRGGGEPVGARETRRGPGPLEPNVTNRVSRGAFKRAVDAGLAIPRH